MANLKKLKSLKLDNNNISSVQALNGLTKLEYLHLSDNNLSDLSPLYKMANIKTIYLSNNPEVTKAKIQALQQALYSARVNKIRMGNPTADVEALRKLIRRSGIPRVEHSLDLTKSSR